MSASNPTLNKVLPRQFINKLNIIEEKGSLDIALVKLMGTGTNSERFLMKMEIKRLRKPCVKRIDMRDKAKADCQVYIFKGINHFMTTQAISFFEQMVDIYQGNYSNGVYESVIAELDNLLDPVSFEKNNHDWASKSKYELFNVAKFSYGLYQTRANKRIFLNTSILVSSSNQKFTSLTYDISFDGLRFSLPKDNHLKADEVVNIHFTGLKKLHMKKYLNKLFSYKIVHIDDKEQKKHVRCVRINKTNEEDDFFKRFTSTQQVFQRVDASDTGPLLLNKGYEQYYAQKSTGIPLFLDVMQDVQHVLASDNNKTTLDFWLNQYDKSVLPLVFTEDLLEKSQATGNKGLIYCIKYEIDKKIHFFVATHLQLLEKRLFDTFLSFGLNRAVFKVFKLQLNPITCPTSKLGLENDGLSKVTIERLERLKELCVLHDITSPHYIEDLKALYRYDKGLPFNDIKQFLLKGETKPLDVVEANFISKRENVRYMHRMEITVSHNQRKFVGQSANFSVHGLSIELEKGITADTGDTINITIPNTKIKSQFYRIVRMNPAKTTIHLKLAYTSQTKYNNIFFEELIKSNQTKLNADYCPTHSKGLLDGLSRLYCRFGSLSVLFLSQEQNKTSIMKYTSSRNNDLSQLMSACSFNKDVANTYPITNSSFGSLIYSKEFLKEELKDGYEINELFICIETNGELPKITTKLASELVSPKIRKLFVENSRRRGQLFVVQVHTTPTNPLDLSFVDACMLTLNRYAQYHIVDVKNELTRIFAAINVVDITKATLFRLGIVQ